ncbi:hypothetical protein PG984_012548 [Apiospora sp. TS-2023a]
MLAYAAAALAGIWLGCAAADQTPPTELFPIVFAIQNFPAAEPLAFYLEWNLGRLGLPIGSDSGFTDSGLIHVNMEAANLNQSKPDTYYATAYSEKLIGDDAEGHWSLAWGVSAHNCTDHDVRFPIGGPGDFSYNSYFYFRLEKGAKPVDFAAVTTNPDTCATMVAMEFNVTGSNHDNSQYNEGLYRDSCATLGDPGVRPAADPCALKIDESQAASISASVTAKRCESPRSTTPAYCPQPTKTNAAAASLSPGRGMATVIGVASAVSLWILQGVS